MTICFSVLQSKVATRLLTAVTKSLQQQGDLTLQDVDDDLQDLSPLEAFPSQEPHALTAVSQPTRFHMPHHHIRPIKQSEVSKGMEPWLLPGLV